MDDYSLQLARVADAPLLAAMSQTLIEAGLRPSWPAARVVKHIRHPDSLVLTAKYHSSIVGFAIMQFGDETAHLNLLAVLPTHRRRGVARKLLTWLEETALTAGTFIVELELRATNTAAHSFYLTMGYQEVGRMAGYYQGIESAIRMARDVRAGRGAWCNGGT